MARPPPTSRGAGCPSAPPCRACRGAAPTAAPRPPSRARSWSPPAAQAQEWPRRVIEPLPPAFWPPVFTPGTGAVPVTAALATRRFNPSIGANGSRSRSAARRRSSWRPFSRRPGARARPPAPEPAATDRRGCPPLRPVRRAVGGRGGRRRLKLRGPVDADAEARLDVHQPPRQRFGVGQPRAQAVVIAHAAARPLERVNLRVDLVELRAQAGPLGLQRSAADWARAGDGATVTAPSVTNTAKAASLAVRRMNGFQDPSKGRTTMDEGRCQSSADRPWRGR